MFVHVPGRRLLLAANSGHGFITNEDDAIAMTRNGKRVMNIKPGVEALVARAWRATISLWWATTASSDFPHRRSAGDGRGQGVHLQKYKDGGLTDATSFTWRKA